jgi:hypothetical protein
MKKYFTWKNFNRVITSTQFLILVFGIIFTVFQIQDIKNNQLNRKNDLSIRYYDRLNTSINQQIQLAIEHNRPILTENKGKFTDDQLDDYLGDLHDVGWDLSSGLLDGDTVCSTFSDLSKNASQNQEIQIYITKIRKDNPTYFLGFDTLYNFTKSCK